MTILKQIFAFFDILLLALNFLIKDHLHPFVDVLDSSNRPNRERIIVKWLHLPDT